MDPPPDVYALTMSNAPFGINLTRLAFNSSTPLAGPTPVANGTTVPTGDAPWLAVLPGGTYSSYRPISA